MKPSEYVEHDSVGLAELVDSGQVTPTELLDVALSITESVNGEVNAVVRLMEDEARAAIANGPKDGPMYGVPYLLKDLTAMYAGVPTTQGSVFFRDNVPDYDTVTVRRLRAAGLVIFGKTNTRNSGETWLLNRSCLVQRAILGILRFPQAAHRVVQRPRLRRASCPRRMPLMVVGRFASPPHVADYSGLSHHVAARPSDPSWARHGTG